jgi:hypothetical protein
LVRRSVEGPVNRHKIRPKGVKSEEKRDIIEQASKLLAYAVDPPKSRRSPTLSTAAGVLVFLSATYVVHLAAH